MNESYFNDFADAVGGKKIVSIGFGGYSDADMKTANVSELLLEDGTTLLLRPPENNAIMGNQVAVIVKEPDYDAT